MLSGGIWIKNHLTLKIKISPFAIGSFTRRDVEDKNLHNSDTLWLAVSSSGSSYIVTSDT